MKKERKTHRKCYGSIFIHRLAVGDTGKYLVYLYISIVRRFVSSSKYLVYFAYLFAKEFVVWKYLVHLPIQLFIAIQVVSLLRENHPPGPSSASWIKASASAWLPTCSLPTTLQTHGDWFLSVEHSEFIPNLELCTGCSLCHGCPSKHPWDHGCLIQAWPMAVW